MNLYIVVEITARELQAKAFLAGLAALEGFKVTFGHEDMIRRVAKLGTPGIFYDKSLHTDYPKLHTALSRLGHRIAVNDEEALTPIPERYTTAVTTKAVDIVDLHLTWGNYQRELVSSVFPQFNHKSVPVGNVRMDLLRSELRAIFQPRVDALKKKHGDFILINTRFPSINNIEGPDAIKRIIEAGLQGNVEVARKAFELDEKIYPKFLEMVEALGRRFPDKTFIIRPHPSESSLSWEKLADSSDNLKVVREGSVHPWILASEMVIQHGCTTAVEAFFLEVPCVSYKPYSMKGIDRELPDAVSYNAFDLEEVCECVAGNRDEDFTKLRPQWTEMAKHYITSTDGPLAAVSTVAELRKLAQVRKKIDIPFMLKTRMDQSARSLNRRFKKWLRSVAGKPKKVKDAALWKPLTQQELKQLLADFSFYDPRFAQLDVKQTYLECFQIRYSQ
ncbi:hypothetical protein GM415_12320 [Pseudodesulfovibrio cashew]|uniref:Surface carbohydrate biosynthesis protein n=1 Tax=Pseudodesulfovibrio cashew TaxID=2678688 RepID=A0A6I6JIH0_9BACT|nr:surface carbohydrate biosynthesis protein [Pseudodesulfovibrio cashew]QGY40880.1 hypothetical protein GM415_12320 [Pseudodesulfovibrio cashew]